MKNKLLSILFFILLNTNLFAENLLIKAKNISIDKNKVFQFLKMKYSLKQRIKKQLKVII